MQDPTLYGPEQEQLKCPRCDSSNTKFCYYNNYNLCQPRHLCKNCKRYWTKGGALRNIPVGGGTRKNAKRSSSTTSSVSPSSTTTTAPAATSSSSSPSTTIGPPAAFDQDRRLVEVNNNNNGSFSSLLGSNVGQYGTSLPQGLNPNTNGPNLQLCGFLNQGPRPTQDSGQTQGQNSGSNGWPDLATYTPGSTFQ